MKKFNIKKFILNIFLIFIICILKSMCLELNSVDVENYGSFTKTILTIWTDSQFLNLIWLLPILLSMNIIAKKYFFEINNFDMRFKSRNNFINKLLAKCCCFSLIVNFVIAFTQIVILSIISNNLIFINKEVIINLIQYMIETTLLNVSIILFAMYIKKIMYVYIIYMIYIVVSLIVIVNLSLVSNNVYFPFINMYYSSQINVISVLLIILFLFLIKRKYIHSDVLGGSE